MCIWDMVIGNCNLLAQLIFFWGGGILNLDILWYDFRGSQCLDSFPLWEIVREKY